MSLSPFDIQRVAERILADYDAHRPNQIFTERGTDWMTFQDASEVRRAVAELRRMRGERCLGYKVGCLSPTVQNQLGVHQPVYGYLWEAESLASGCHLPYWVSGGTRRRPFNNLAIEGEIALTVCHDMGSEIVSDDEVLNCVGEWFPVVELHNYVFRGTTPTIQELVAGNAMHAGYVAPLPPHQPFMAALARAEIRVEIDGNLAELKCVAELPGGLLGSIRWLASTLRASNQRLKAGDIVLAGSPGRLIPVNASCSIVVSCEGQRVDLFVEQKDTAEVAQTSGGTNRAEG